MPTYEMICSKCQQRVDITCKISEYDKMLKKSKCPECKKKLERFFESLPNMTIPANCTHDGYLKVVGSPKGSSKRLPIPLNFIDEKPDGSYRITRIGDKKDIDND
jgi:putative FmdB family regulatory protein